MKKIFLIIIALVFTTGCTTNDFDTHINTNVNCNYEYSYGYGFNVMTGKMGYYYGNHYVCH